jgi:RNA polymerase sigma factor (sigma-70 family)
LAWNSSGSPDLAALSPRNIRGAKSTPQPSQMFSQNDFAVLLTLSGPLLAWLTDSGHNNAIAEEWQHSAACRVPPMERRFAVMSTNQPARFETTAWSMVRGAQDRGSPASCTAINRFASRYWPPVFYFLRTRGYSLHEAEDLTQEFFLKFLERDWIARADPARGRFRNYLLTILTRFLADQGRQRVPLQRDFDNRLLAISTLMGDCERAFEPQTNLTPEQVFMREWANSIIRTVEQGVSAWCDEQGRPDWFEIFSLHHFPPPGAARLSQQAIAVRCRLSRDQVRYALDETNRQFVGLLRQELADQVDSPEELEQEIAELSSLLAH